MDVNLEQYVRRAKDGNLQALEEVVCGIQEKIYIEVVNNTLKLPAEAMASTGSIARNL